MLFSFHSILESRRLGYNSVIVEEPTHRDAYLG